MHVFKIKSIPGFDEWREIARICLVNNIRPESILFQVKNDESEGHAGSLFDQLPQSNLNDFKATQNTQKKMSKPAFKISNKTLQLLETAACHSDPDRFNLLYRLLYRLRENPKLLTYYTDNDVMALRGLIKAVNRDGYKIKAFLRFREVQLEEDSYYVAWYEPEHYTLEKVLNFFCTRFKNMRWSILTPYKAAHWNEQNLTLEDNPDPSLYPKEDTLESYWLTYYASTFNPNRVKVQAMLNQMPKKYWKNMPETALIEGMLKGHG